MIKFQKMFLDFGNVHAQHFGLDAPLRARPIHDLRPLPVGRTRFFQGCAGMIGILDVELARFGVGDAVVFGGVEHAFLGGEHGNALLRIPLAHALPPVADGLARRLHVDLLVLTQIMIYRLTIKSTAGLILFDS